MAAGSTATPSGSCQAFDQRERFALEARRPELATAVRLHVGGSTMSCQWTAWMPASLSAHSYVSRLTYRMVNVTWLEL